MRRWPVRAGDVQVRRRAPRGVHGAPRFPGPALREIRIPYSVVPPGAFTLRDAARTGTVLNLRRDLPKPRVCDHARRGFTARHGPADVMCALRTPIDTVLAEGVL